MQAGDLPVILQLLYTPGYFSLGLGTFPQHSQATLPMTPAQQLLQQRLMSFDFLEEEVAGYMASQALPLAGKKGNALLRKGQIEERTYFLVEGLAMQSFRDGTRVRATSFHLAGDFFLSLESFLYTQPSEFDLTLLEESELLYWDKATYHAFLEDYPDAVRLSLTFTQELLLQEYKLKSRLIAYSADQMYAYLIESRPDFVQRVPLSYLASYMGISQEHLSRVRGRV